MRKFLNWYSIAVIVILIIACIIFIYVLTNPYPDGSSAIVGGFFLFLLILVFIIISIIGIIIGSPKSDVGKNNNDGQERTRDIFPTRLRIATISFIISIFITFTRAFLINVGAFEPWRKFSPSAYNSILEITTNSTVKVSNPSGETFIIDPRFVDKCNDDECLKMEEEVARGDSTLDNRCFPKGLPPRPPVKMASEEKVFRSCIFGGTVEYHYFISDNGDLWHWEKLINQSFWKVYGLSLFTAIIFTLFVVAFYSTSGRFRKKTTSS